jgi:hypothetical protein
MVDMNQKCSTHFLLLSGNISDCSAMDDTHYPLIQFLPGLKMKIKLHSIAHLQTYGQGLLRLTLKAAGVEADTVESE